MMWLSSSVLAASRYTLGNRPNMCHIRILSWRARASYQEIFLGYGHAVLRRHFVVFTPNLPDLPNLTQNPVAPCALNCLTLMTY